MTRISIYVEGGGDSREQKAQLRRGMDAFLAAVKQRVRERRWRWSVVFSGGRQEAFEAFQNARAHRQEAECVILLVDSEEVISMPTRAQHLHERDGWNFAGASESDVHLMVQVMEAWIVADPDALADYYGQGFRNNALPQRQNLEEEPKHDCLRKLAEATRETRKGEYHKIRHASDLLARISPAKVRARCHHAAIFLTALDHLVA